jgi:uncharacterized protein
MKYIQLFLVSLKRFLQGWAGLIALLVTILQLTITPAHATGAIDIPKLKADTPTWVVDQGEVLSRVTEAALNKTFSDLAQQTGYQVRVITIHRLDYGETPASLAQKILERWFPEPASQAKQGVLLVDTVTNGVALQTGSDIQSVLSATVAQSIVADNLGIPLRESKYNQAIQGASNRLVAVLTGQPDPGAPQIVETGSVEGNFAKAEDTDRGSATLWVVGLLVVATVVPMATYYFYVFLQSRA